MIGLYFSFGFCQGSIPKRKDHAFSWITLETAEILFLECRFRRRFFSNFWWLERFRYNFSIILKIYLIISSVQRVSIIKSLWLEAKTLCRSSIDKNTLKLQLHRGIGNWNSRADTWKAAGLPKWDDSRWDEPIGLALDNFDELTNTLSGSNTLYDTMGILYQNIPRRPEDTSGWRNCAHKFFHKGLQEK